MRGEVLEVALDHAVIEAAGVGYRVNATPSTLSTLRTEAIIARPSASRPPCPCISAA
ncbi:OB-fold domain-containing protein, partial [Mycobacterium avium]|uniref:OB-fold domain-containing protein n=1 Tax=Mycobacterium avium TaxID=1764 RepID=UPI0027B9254D